MITWLSNVVTGRFKHWNEANTSYVTELVERAKAFPPAIAPLFVQFTAASHAVIDSLLGPDKGRKRIIKIDPLRIKPEQFQALHHLNLWTFVALFVQQNPQFRDSFFAACEDYVGIQDREKRITQFVLEMKSMDIGKLCSQLFPEIAAIIHYQGEHFPNWVLLTPLVATAYSEAMEAYKNAMRKMSRAGAQGA